MPGRPERNAATRGAGLEQAGAAGVDEQRRRLHAREFAGGDDAARGGDQRFGAAQAIGEDVLVVDVIVLHGDVVAGEPGKALQAAHDERENTWIGIAFLTAGFGTRRRRLRRRDPRRPAFFCRPPPGETALVSWLFSHGLRMIPSTWQR
jgi:hypothetical protein